MTEADDDNVVWVDNERQVRIEAEETIGPDGEDMVAVSVHDTIETDQYVTSVMTYSQLVPTDDADAAIDDCIERIESGRHQLYLLAVEAQRDSVQFYCVLEESLPGDMTAVQLDEMLSDAGGNEDDDDVWETDYDPEQTIQVDVFPRPRVAVEKHTDADADAER